MQLRGDVVADDGESELLFRQLAHPLALAGGSRSIAEGDLADKRGEGKDLESSSGLEHSQL